MAPNERALAVRAAMADQPSEQTRGSLRLVLDAPVGLVTNKQGEVIGVDAWVRLFDGFQEVPIDPHRNFVNPPTNVVIDNRVGFDAQNNTFVDREIRHDPVAAFWDILWESVTQTPNPQGWLTRGTVTTVFSGTTDGQINSQNVSGDYASARAGSTLTADSASTTFIVGQDFTATKIGTYDCWEGFLSFDTSSVPDSDTVSAITLDCWLVTDSSVTDFTVEARESNWGTGGLTTADWVAGASLSGLTLMASIGTSGIGATGAYKTFTSQAAFLSATNLKTGTVHLLLDSSRHLGNNTPVGDEFVIFSSADNTGTTQDPKLTITHANTPPVADAGLDQVVNEGVTVNLDGSGSTDDLGITGYAWTVLNDGGTGLTTGDITNAGNVTASFAAPQVTGATPKIITIQLQVTDTGGLTDTDTMTVTVSDVTTGSGGLVLGSATSASFTNGATAQVNSDIVVEWDFDNDGDFGESLENITLYVASVETLTGRDWPSQLTGKAGPGKFRATLINEDDRFSYFNMSSPLNASPFSLKTGRKLRVRTSTAGNPEPTLLAKDRFGRADGALGIPEVGAAWSGPLANDFTIVGQEAVASSEGNIHIGLIDVGATNYYAQIKMSEVGAKSNVVGLVYRYQDTSNYSLAVVDVAAAQIKLIDVVAGAPTTVQSEAVEPYDDMTVGVLVSGSSVTFYHEGVAVMTGTATQTDETEVGIYANWGTGDTRPELDDFFVWSGLPVGTEGILWTGDLADLVTTVVPGPRKLATIDGEGWLSRLATQEIRPPSTIAGRKTGILVGDTLSSVGLLHPPGSIDEGDVTTGPFAMEDANALEVARRFEETEFGFLHESQEGPIGYDSRTARSTRSSQATFSDADGAQFGYSEIAPFDWRREVVNRVFAEVAPRAPSGISTTTHTQTMGSQGDGDLVITMPSIVNAGDLLLVIVSACGANSTAAVTWNVPVGWKDLTEGQNVSTGISFEDTFRVFAKVADGSEDSDAITFATGGSVGVVAGAAAAQIYRVTDWFGTLDGVAINDYGLGSNPSVILIPWGLKPSLVIAIRHAGGTDITPGTTGYPLGYSGGISTLLQSASDALVESAQRLVVDSLEDPANFGGTTTSSIGFNNIVIAVQGYGGTPPGSGVVVQVDDIASQDDHNAIRTHTNPSNLFASEADAGTYANLVIATHADDRPILELSFWATRSAAYRNQAIRRRVGDKVTVVASNETGLGFAADFFIESISHKWTDGAKLWKTTWTLSPA